jgi:hypothetical protein
MLLLVGGGFYQAVCSLVKEFCLNESLGAVTCNAEIVLIEDFCVWRKINLSEGIRDCGKLAVPHFKLFPGIHLTNKENCEEPQSGWLNAIGQ